MPRLIILVLSFWVMLGFTACSSTPGVVIIPSPSPTTTLHPNDIPLPTPESVTDAPVIVWERTGGIAGICQQLTIFKDGNFVLVNCKSGMMIKEGILSNEQWAPFINLLDQYSKYNWKISVPPGVMDAFVDKYTFLGSGTTAASPNIQDEINGLLADLAGSLASTQPTDSITGDTLASGIQGQVWIGPTCPGPVSSDQSQSAECSDKPYQTTITVLGANNQVVTTFETDFEGKFYITLDPGTYTLVTNSQSNQPLPRAKPQVVTVKEGAYTQITISLDTGIR